MKRSIVVLQMLLFSLSSYGQTNCVGSLSVSLTPPMPVGGYAPGTTVSVCVNLINYSQGGASWLHGIGISFGPGWDTSTLVPANPFAGCDNQGMWQWYSSCTASGSGQTFGPGFYYDSPLGSPGGISDNIPGNNYGDNCQTHTWNYCLTIQTAAVSSAPIPLTGTVIVTSDGHSGSWGTSGCSIEYNSFNALMGGNPCYASFQLATPPVVQMPLSFVNTSAGVSPAYLWNFGDGTTGTVTHPTHSYISIGTYPVCLTVSTAACSDTLCTNLQIIPNYWQTIYPYFAAGEVYYDLDSNGVRGPYEPGLQGIEMTLSPIGISAWTQATGAYNFPVNSGSYSISAPSIPNWALTSDSASYTFTIGSASGSNFHFGYKPVQQVSGMELNFNEGPPGCIWPVSQQIQLRNTGTIPTDGMISYIKHDSVNVIAASPLPDSVVQQVYYWSYHSLTPFGIYEIDLIVKKPVTVGYPFYHVVYGDTRNNSGQVILSETDTIHELVLCSYDPNDKLVSPVTNVQGQNYTQLNEELTYTIRFQNTGNAPAINVTIVDTLPSVMDISSFQLISASHQVDVHITPTGIATFNFYGINLPDSTTNVAESHGFISFRLSPLPGLANNTPVENTAHIFFDSNSPVITNTAQTTYVISIPVGLNETGSDNEISIYPNPSSSFYTIYRNRADLPCTVKIVNVLGSPLVIETMDVSTHSVIIDGTLLSSGIYLMVMEDPMGTTVMKLMKK